MAPITFDFTPTTALNMNVDYVEILDPMNVFRNV
jgi:hypothetical protein